MREETARVQEVLKWRRRRGVLGPAGGGGGGGSNKEACLPVMAAAAAARHKKSTGIGCMRVCGWLAAQQQAAFLGAGAACSLSWMPPVGCCGAAALGSLQ